jgi:hypothetical protein
MPPRDLCQWYAHYGLHREPVEMPPALRMASEILRTFEKFLDEAGCPLTPAQVVAVERAHRVMAEQVTA